MRIIIANDLHEKLPDFDIIALCMDVSYCEGDLKVNKLITQYEEKISKLYTLEEILSIPLIKEARDAYKLLKKDPSRYRLACESLIRRLVKGNNLYIINNLVDVGNILSIDCYRSVAVLDYNKIIGDITIRLGNNNDIYEGINRGLINVENIPLYVDQLGPFGSTTSDTVRTSITSSTTKILLFIICFSEKNKNRDKQKAIDLYSEYAQAQNVSELIVEKEKNERSE